MNEVMKEFLTYVLVLVCIYTAQTGFKIASTWKDGTFDWKKLIEGILQYSIYFLSVFVFFLGGTLIPDKQIIPLNDKTLTITDALTLTAYALLVAQAGKMFKNILETFKVKEEEVSKQVHERKEA